MATTQQQLTAHQLALYLGRKVSTDVGIGVIDTISLHNTVLVAFDGCDEDEACDFPCDKVKPILRCLDSITEEEARDLYEIYNGEKWVVEDWHDEYNGALPDWWKLNDELYREVRCHHIGYPHIWLYLISIGIDLFGWIDAGLAIDKATL